MPKNKIGNVIELYYSTASGRVHNDKLELDDKGVLEDKYYNKDVQRSVLITSQDSYILASDKNINIPRGSLGENLLIDYNPYGLKLGTQIQINDLVLEITQNCTICNSLAKVDKDLPTLLKNDRGIFAKVIHKGVIHQGDNIYLLN